MPDEHRRSISAQSGGAEHVIIVPVSFSTQRNAEMSSLDPSRIPAWLAPVCEERSVSHSVRRCVPSASQRAIVGALPSRIARRRTGRASPSISRNTIPGTSVLSMMPWRRAIRCAIRIDDMSSVPSMTASTTLTAATTSAASSAQPKPSTVSTPSVSASVRSRMPASANSTSRKPRTSVSGRRSAASTGGMTAFSAATITATSSAPQKPSMLTPGRIPAATTKAMPVASHETTSGNRRSGGSPGTGSDITTPIRVPTRTAAGASAAPPRSPRRPPRGRAVEDAAERRQERLRAGRGGLGFHQRRVELCLGLFRRALGVRGRLLGLVQPRVRLVGRLTGVRLRRAELALRSSKAAFAAAAAAAPVSGAWWSWPAGRRSWRSRRRGPS